jgi:hypothetical protein
MAEIGVVGWVERSETNLGSSPVIRPLMGFAALNRSYGASNAAPFGTITRKQVEEVDEIRPSL